MVIPFAREEHFREKMARNLLRWYMCNDRLFLEGGAAHCIAQPTEK